MATWKERILDLLSKSPGLTDREITDRLAGPQRHQATFNQACRQLEKERKLIRRGRDDGRIGNYLASAGTSIPLSRPTGTAVTGRVSRPSGHAPSTAQTPTVPNRDRVGRALELLRGGLYPFVDRTMRAHKGSSWAHEFDKRPRSKPLADCSLHLDTPTLLRAIDRHWGEIFSDVLDRVNRALVNELITIRNNWAHDRLFTSIDTLRALDSTKRLLEAVAAKDKAEEIDRAYYEVMRGIVDEDARSPMQAPAAPIGDTDLTPETVDADGWLAEDDVKRYVEGWLNGLGWHVTVAWGKERGLDIKAEKGDERWLIEAKGSGSRPEMQVNYFLSVLGETLQRMDDPSAHYSIALPSMRQFRGLWSRLPALAKSRLGITALFVNQDGTIEEPQE
jgi:hypothetical protein